MNSQQFLARLSAICLHEVEKENQILSQKENEKRKDRLKLTELPLSEKIPLRKAGKKITFKLDEKLIAQQSDKREAFMQIPRGKKEISKISTDRTITKEILSEKATKELLALDFTEILRKIRHMR